MKLLLIICISILANICTASFCHWNSGCPYKYFGPATSYNVIRGDIRDSIVKLRGCEPISVWSLFSNGKRYPALKFGKDMKDALAIRNYVLSSYESGRSSLCAQDIEDLNNWPTDPKMFNGALELMSEGYEDMLGIGKRIKEAFPKLFENFEKGSYTFRPAVGPWLKESSEAFIKGLGNGNLYTEDALKDHDIMNAYLSCEKYRTDVYHNPKTYVEAEKYMKTPQYLAAKDRIQRRSGIDYVLTDTNITALYDLCRFTSSDIGSRLSPWCALFTKDDLQELEYIEDLISYYRNGYGVAQNEILGRVPLADLFSAFEKVKDNKESKKITGYFTYPSMFNMVYTTLGLFKDHKPLSSINRDRERKWRTSVNSIFSLNLLAILNRCTKDGNTEYNVVFYLNEDPIRSICADGVCTWNEFQDKLSPFVNTTFDFC